MMGFEHAEAIGKIIKWEGDGNGEVNGDGEVGW